MPTRKLVSRNLNQKIFVTCSNFEFIFCSVFSFYSKWAGAKHCDQFEYTTLDGTGNGPSSTFTSCLHPEFTLLSVYQNPTTDLEVDEEFLYVPFVEDSRATILKTDDVQVEWKAYHSPIYVSTVEKPGYSITKSKGHFPSFRKT